MNRCSSSCIWVLLIFLSLFQISTTCWGGPGSNVYGHTTRDYDLLVGAELVIDCSLRAATLPSIPIPVNSSFLVFKKDNHPQLPNSYVHPTGPLTAQLRIPNAQVHHSGIYYCKMVLPDNSHELVCSTNVNIGYPPKNVSNFKCISKNFDNLTCTWDIEPNNVKTNYSLQKMLIFQDNLQNCPKPHNNTFCQWRSDTDPPYIIMDKTLTFLLRGNNSLGVIENRFKLDLYDIVIPNSPKNPTVIKVGKTFGEIKWFPPEMQEIEDRPDLYYQLWLEELENHAYVKVVINVGVKQHFYRLDGLIPNFHYKVSLRCRLNHTSKEEMWSPFTSVFFDTDADVPYISPEVNPEAFVVHNFGSYRNTTLYWKPVPSRFHNGEDFHYHIRVMEMDNTKPDPSLVKTTNSHTASVIIGHLSNDSSYVFHVYSANREGISDDFQTVFIDKRSKIPSGPKDIRAISHDLGYYNLSWSVPGDLEGYKFTVFWCSGRKPGQCDKSIQWSDAIVKENTFSLGVPDATSNFQFAVAATYMNRSTGMQWASCIVPNKAPLGQIPISHIEPTSNTLRVIWKLDCKAQKSVIRNYVITYCAEGSECNDVEADPDVSSYTLKNLHPFTNYSVKLRAFNFENKPSEDVDPMHQNTLSGGPKDSPQSVKLIWRSDSAFHVSWTPPKEPNGIITHYWIFQNEYKHRMNDTSSCKTCEFKIKNLRPYTYYNVSIQACVDIFCSPESSPVSVLTAVAVPGIMDPPRIETVNETHLKISWASPVLPNGPLDFFDIQQKQENGNDSDRFTIPGNEKNSMLMEFKCPNVLEKGMKYAFQIRAGNIKNGTILYGPYSDPTLASVCVMSQGLAMVLGIAIGGTLALAIFLLVSYRLVKWMSDKIHHVKNIAVRLPKELEGPEMNPLSNYECVKNGIAHSVTNGKVEHLSYVIDQSENKNRHGSGSSQFSNSSTDELIFKNGRCTKFGRKPSGDSSGCSSMSSNTTNRIHLSSESDTAVPSSPDSLLTEQTFLTGFKPPMPILMETSDHQETYPKTNEQLRKYNNFTNGMVLKVDQPYSKFGISGNVTSSAPCQINPLAFYSCNLANSEPSVFETKSSKKPNFSIPPYSKVGLAKSSGDILSISNRNNERGYSKFGFESRDCFSVDAEKLNPTVGIALVENAPQFFTFDSAHNDSIRDYHDSWPYSRAAKQNISASTPLKKNEMAQSSLPGYVSVSEMRNPVDYNNLPSPTSSVEEYNSAESSEELTFNLHNLNSSLSRESLDLSFLKVDPFLNPDPGKISGGPTDATPSNCTSCDHNVVEHCSSPTIPPSGTDLPNPLQEKCGLLNSEPDSGKTPLPKDLAPLKPSEVLLTPATVNGYVPFSTVSFLNDSQASIVPKTPESNASLSVFPGDICPDTDVNYITPSNKGDMKLLHGSLTSRHPPFRPYSHCNPKDSPDASDITEINSRVKYFLKSLPKMETEICEV